MLTKMNKIPIPPFVRLTKELAWCIGFYLAEGNKTKEYIGVSNCNINLIERFKNVMEEVFKIENSQWKVHIKTSDKNIDAVERKWRDFLGTNNSNALYTKYANYDNVELRFNSRKFANFFNKFLEKSVYEIKTNKNMTVSFLDGYEAGDGSVIQRRGFLYGIAFTTKSELYKNLIVKMFELHYGIKPRVRLTKKCFGIEICGIKIMTKLILDRHFNSHAVKWSTLINSYVKKQYVRSHVRYWKALKNGPKNVLDISGLINRSHWSVRDALNADHRIGLIDVVTKKPKSYKLSPAGEQLIGILEGEEM